MKRAFLYTDRYANYDYGPTHPLKILRLHLTHALIEAYGLLSLPQTEVVETRFATEEELKPIHSEDYLQILRSLSSGVEVPSAYRHGLGPGDNPIFPGLWEWSLLVCGASIQGAEHLATGEADAAFNIAGGLHHAMRSKASGFCYLNDPAAAIAHLVKEGKRVIYIDVDAHHGDGVQDAFYDSDRVLTVSLHEDGNYLFPGTGFPHEMGIGKGKGYSVNLPLSPGTDDDTYLWAFRQVVPPLIEMFRPDVMVTQLGTDSFRTDPLAHLNITTEGFSELVRILRGFHLPWLALGGGGYNVMNVARGWTLAWGIMNDQELSDELPEGFIRLAARMNLHPSTLRDEPWEADPATEKRCMESAQKGVDHIERHIFPLVCSA